MLMGIATRVCALARNDASIKEFVLWVNILELMVSAGKPMWI